MGLDGKETSEPCDIDEDIMTVAIHDKKIDIEIIREKVQVAFIADKMVESCLWFGVGYVHRRALEATLRRIFRTVNSLIRHSLIHAANFI
jgi:hypothetical protein